MGRKAVMKRAKCYLQNGFSAECHDWDKASESVKNALMLKALNGLDDEKEVTRERGLEKYEILIRAKSIFENDSQSKSADQNWKSLTKEQKDFYISNAIKDLSHLKASLKLQREKEQLAKRNFKNDTIFKLGRNLETEEINQLWDDLPKHEKDNFISDAEEDQKRKKKNFKGTISNNDKGGKNSRDGPSPSTSVNICPRSIEPPRVPLSSYLIFQNERKNTSDDRVVDEELMAIWQTMSFHNKKTFVTKAEKDMEKYISEKEIWKKRY